MKIVVTGTRGIPNDMSKESYYARLIPFYKRVMNIYRQTNSI